MFKSIIKFITAAAIGAIAVINVAGTPLESIHNILDLHIVTGQQIEEIRDESYSCGYEAGHDHSGIYTDVREYETVPASQNTVTWATVYFTEYGECYHTDPNCTSLRRSKTIYEASLEDLNSNGSSLRPCKLCVPCDYD
jgi:hypothetical protein